MTVTSLSVFSLLLFERSLIFVHSLLVEPIFILFCIK